jgi:release factor glutamine methyltransferase
MRIVTLLQSAHEQLLGKTATPKLDAEILLAHVLCKSRSYLYAWPEQNVATQARAQFQSYLRRRCQLEPLAYIIETKEFWSLPFYVSQATLIPRPETELLVEQILALSFSDDSIELADLGTGCGTIALSIGHERPGWHIHATDICSNALRVAQKNAEQFHLTNISFHQGNWCNALPKQLFSVIVSNPPYIAHEEWADYANGLVYEPKSALISGKDGLDAIREIVSHAKAYLKPKGYVLIEHGFNQGAKVQAVFTKEGYQDIITCHDLSGHARITCGRYLP